MIPILVAGLLVALFVLVLPSVIAASLRMRQEEKSIRQWPQAPVGSAIATTFVRVKSLVSAGASLDVTGLAIIGIAERLPKSLTWARYLSQSAVYIGLAGALLGLQEAIGGMGGLSMSNLREVQNFVDRVRVVLDQFGFAFWAALAGIFVTVVLYAFLNALDRRIYDVEIALEDKIRNVLILEAGAQQKADPAFEELKNLAIQLSAAISQARPSLEATLDDMSRTSAGLREMIDTAAVGLGQVRDEFNEASKSLSSALREGAQAVEASADRLATRLADAAHDAGHEIASSASTGAEAIRTEIEVANQAQTGIIETVNKATAVVEGMQDSLDQLTKSLRSADKIHQNVAEVQEELRRLAEVHKQFALGVRGDLLDANQPLLKRLDEQEGRIGELASSLTEALRSHRDFLTEMSGHAAATADVISHEKVAAVVDQAFVPLRKELEMHNGLAVQLKQDIDLLEESINSLGNLAGSDQKSLLERLADLDRRLESTQQGDYLERISRDLEVLKRSVRDVEDRVNSPVYRRFLGKR